MPACHSTAIGSGLDDLRLTTILVCKGDLCGLTSFNCNGLGGRGIIDPVLLGTIRLSDIVSTWFQIQGDNTGRVGHIVTNLGTAGVLHCEVPACHSTAIGSGLDDLRLTTILVCKGDLCGLTCLDSHRLGRCGIINPVFLGTIGFCNRIGAGFQIQGYNTGAISHIVTNLGTAGVLHREVPARYGTAVGSGLDDLCFTLPLVGKGYAGSFTGFNCNLSRRCSIINPVLVRSSFLCY